MGLLSFMDSVLDRVDAALDFIAFQGDKNRSLADEIEINGVTLPRMVAEQLKMQGIALSNYSPGELRAAVRACAYDGRLIDDENGTNFLDKLELTGHEKQQQDAAEKGSFRERILKEREEKSLTQDEGKH